jgi:hypothetical protein
MVINLWLAYYMEVDSRIYNKNKIKNRIYRSTIVPTGQKTKQQLYTAMSAFHLGPHPKIPIRHQRVGPTNFSTDRATRTNAVTTDSMD